MSARGKGLELGIVHAAAAYRKQGLAALVRQYPRTARGADGFLVYAGDAPLDFIGARAGGKALAIEAKEHDEASFPLSDDHLAPAQIAACNALVGLGVEVQLVIDFRRHAEVYAIEWMRVAAFLAAPWRKSLSLDWVRAYGLLVPEVHREDEVRRRTLVLDGDAHPDCDNAFERVALERLTSPVITPELKLEADDARDRRPGKRQLARRERLAARPDPRDREAYQEYMRGVVAEGVDRQLGAASHKPKFGRGKRG